MSTFMDLYNSKKNELLQSVAAKAARNNNKVFLEAAIASLALIMAADGTIADDEVDTAVDFVTATPALACFKAEEKTGLMQQFLVLAKDKMQQAILLGKVASVKTSAEGAATIAEICIVMAESDGDFADTEKKMFGRICRTLGLNAADYIE